MTGKIAKLGVALLVTAAVASTVAVRAANSPDAYTKMRLQRKIERHRQSQQRANEVNREWVKTQVVRESAMGGGQFDASIIGEQPIINEAFFNAGAVPPAPSPGQNIGATSYDYQANSSQAFNVARLNNNPPPKPGGDPDEAEPLHFTWMAFDIIPATPEQSNRFVRYNIYFDPYDYPTMNLGPNGSLATYNGTVMTGQTNRAGYCNIDIDKDNVAGIGMHQAVNDYNTDPYAPWHIDIPFQDPSTPNILPLPQTGYLTCGHCPGQPQGTGGVLWPRIAGDRGTNIMHEIAHSNVNDCATEELWYWRFDGNITWTGPALINNTDEISYALAVDDIGTKVAVVTHRTTAGFTNVEYIESANDGSDWLALTCGVSPLPTPIPITNYGPPNAQTAWVHIAACYDHAATPALHVVWDEQENSESEHIAMKHWRSTGTDGIRTIALGYWDRPASSGVFNLNLAKPSVGIGDGSTICSGQPNANYVYVTYTQFYGNTALELSDYSSEVSYEGRTGGYGNGELYLAISNTNGKTWSPPLNLTNTKTPGCHPGPATPNPTNPDSVCRSEHWATLNRVVGDVDIFYISDVDAGGIPQGEGSWQINGVHYLQIEGTDNGTICPVIAPVFEAILTSDPTCEYHATRNGQTTTQLRVLNLGNATLNQGTGGGIVVTDFPGLPTLSLPQTGNYSIPAGDPDIVQTVTMTAGGAAEGLYLGQISISHNDANPNNPSPRLYPIEFFVFDIFNCPEAEYLKTGVASPGSLQLTVETNGRFASQDGEGGLWRFNDSSSSFFDASLLAAYGTQGPTDTTVFHRFFDRLSNGQNGWRSQSPLFVDTAKYGTGSGYAVAGAYMSTRDSAFGVNMSWYFPQATNADEVVFVKYMFFPGPKWDGAATISNVTTGLLADMDVLPGQYPPVDTMQAGVNNKAFGDDSRKLAYVRGTNKPNSVVSGNNDVTQWRAGIAVPTGQAGAYIGNNEDNQTGGGPTDGHLYNVLLNVTNVEIGEPGDTDLYILTAFDRGVSYAPVANKTWRTSTVVQHIAVLASDSTSDASFKATVDAAAAIVNANTFGDGCVVCPCRYDPACDGFTTVLDVVHAVGGAFRNITADPAGPSMSACNFDSRDVDANGVITILDVVKLVGVAFRNVDYKNAVPANPSFVDPCTKWREWN